MAVPLHGTPSFEVGAGFNVQIRRTSTGWTAVVFRITNLAGPEVFSSTVLTARPTTNSITTVFRDCMAACLNDLADAEPASFSQQPH